MLCTYCGKNLNHQMGRPTAITVYNIIEVANVHGGDFNHMKSLIEEFEEFKTNFGIKFQPLKYDEIALKDYSWYKVYKELFFAKDKWKEIITHASQSKDIWIDVFDSYGVEIIADNLSSIYGIKFQAGVLDNKVVQDGLSNLDLSGVLVIINISAYSLEQICELIERIKNALKPKELILQIGFQDYPTQLADCGISKIKELKKKFSNRLSFADHLDASSEHAIQLPAYAVELGAEIIEKHVMHSTREARYDFYSSLKIANYEKYLQLLNSAEPHTLYTQYQPLLNKPFINDNERSYLAKTLQIPVFNKAKSSGSLVNAWEDFSFKRTDQQGLNIDQVRELTGLRQLLNNEKAEGSVLEKSDFREARIAAIIACRLKSSRLPKKALLNIGDISSVELCIKNTLRFENIHDVILATSTEVEDEALKDYTYKSEVIFHKGDPEDVIQRYLDIINKLSIDVIVRITADMPYVSNDILQILLASHFASGADYTVAKQAAVGTNLEIINTMALKKVKKYFPRAEYSEYMTYYFQNNPTHFHLNFVDLPENLIRDYRLTLDYSQDLEMFNHIENYFTKHKGVFSIIDLFQYLDDNPDIAAINEDCDLKYQTNPELISELKKHTTIQI